MSDDLMKVRPAIQNNLLVWFKSHQRKLPWREHYEPYEVWISEIMLQQTQVKTALPYFKRWMETLPTIAAVAQADEQTILKLWEGLGYYSRARNLHKAAKQIMDKHGGKFPTQYEEILALPGIGKYTAGAISSIALNREKPIVDGNVIRVLSRLQDDARNTRETKVINDYWKWAEQLIPEGKAREFNQAMMELGALVCTPKSPACGTCPLQNECAAFKAETVHERPNRGPKKQTVNIQVAIAILKNSNKIFIQKRAHKGLMGGLWEFPGGKLKRGETPHQGLKREIREELNITIKNPQPFMKLKHAYTKFKVDLHCFLAEPESTAITLNSATDHRWISLEEIDQFPFPAANKRIIQKLQQAAVIDP